MHRKSWLTRVKQIVLIICAIGTLVLTVTNVRFKPDLTYEDNVYPTDTQSYLICITARNEGRAAAEEVEIAIKVNVDGELGKTWVQKSRILGEIEEAERFTTPAQIHKNKLGRTISIPNIPGGIKYEIGLIIKPRDHEVSYGVLVTSKNGGEAQKMRQKGLETTLKLFLLGAGFGTLVTLLILRWPRRRKSSAGEV